MSDIRKTLDKLNEMTAGSVATVATPLFKETVKREKTDETTDSGKKYMNSVERGVSEWGNWASSKKKKTVAEAANPITGDEKKEVPKNKKELKQQTKADTKQKAKDAFGSMFGGGNPADKLGIRKESVDESSENTQPKLGTVKANMMNTKEPTVQVQVYKHNTLRGDSYWVTKEVKKFKTIAQAQAYIDRINKQGVAEGAPELLKQEMPLVQHIERELAKHGYEKGTPEYDQMFKHSMAMYRKFGNIDAIKQGVAEGYQDDSKEREENLRYSRSRNPVADAIRKKLNPNQKEQNKEQGVAEGTNKNVVKSVKVGNFRHDLVDTGMGWQVRIYNGDELYDTGMSKNSEQKGLAALEDAVAYTEKQTRTKRQGVAEGSSNWYVRVRGKVLKDKQFNAIPFPSKEAASQKAFEIHNKKHIPLEMIKLSQSWMDGPKQDVAEGLDEGWKISTPIDKERYTDMSDQGLEGPFRLKSGKIVYYDPKEGKYYDRDTDMYMDYDEYQSHTNEEALMELGYEGNIGAMEMVKFFRMADPRQKEILNQLIKEKEFQRAWALIQGVTGDKLVGKEFSTGEIAEQLSEDLRAWFGKGGEGGAGGGGWDRYNTKGERIGKCGERKAGEGKPKCLSKEKAASLRSSGGKKAIAAAVRKKRREDPNPQRQGAADMVSNKTKNESLEYYVKEGICPQCNGEMVSEALFTEGKKDACYHKVKSRYKIWPSAYASGALVKCRKAGAKNWGNKSKNESINEGRADDLERALMQARKITKGISYDTTVNEIMVAIEELVKSYNLDMDDFNWHNNRVYEAKHELESSIYDLDEIFEDALRDAKFSDEEGINEADLARRGFLGTLGKAAAAGAAVAAGGKALGQEKRSVNISVDEADNQIKALRNQAYQDLASMMWSVWPYILDKKFGNLTPQDDIPTAEEIGKIISNRIGRKLEEYANEYRKKVHIIKVNAGITDPSRLYKTSAMLESSNKADLSEQDLIVMPGKMRMRGDIVKAKHMGPDHEVSMAVNSLLSTVKSAMSLAKIIKSRSEGQGLPGWVSDHITRADELIKDVAEYMEGHEAQKNMLEGKKHVKR